MLHLLTFFIGLCTEAYHLSQSVCAFIIFFNCTDVKLERNVCISAIWKWLNFNLLLINFLVFLVEKCVFINHGELWSINVLQCYENLYNCELFWCFRIFYLLIHACLSPACFDIIILKRLILQFRLGKFSITWEVCGVWYFVAVLKFPLLPT